MQQLQPADISSSSLHSLVNSAIGEIKNPLHGGKKPTNMQTAKGAGQKRKNKRKQQRMSRRKNRSTK